MNSGKVILGVLGGIAAGAVLGILFAPHKGTVTRKKIKRKKDSFVEDLKDIKEEVSDFVESMSEKMSSISENVSEMAHKAKSKVDGEKVGSNHNQHQPSTVK